MAIYRTPWGSLERRISNEIARDAARSHNPEKLMRLGITRKWIDRSNITTQLRMYKRSRKKVTLAGSKLP